jgi:integrase
VEEEMARQHERLTSSAIQKIIRTGKPGRYADGDGLYLSLSRTGGASWDFRYRLASRKRYMGLGSLRVLPLTQARLAAAQARILKQRGIDPIDARAAERQGTAIAAAKTVTFKECAEIFIRLRTADKTPATAKQWSQSFEDYVYPLIGALPPAAIDTTLVLKILEPLWGKIPETAERVRNRLENVLDAARTRGYREGDNPARWRGHLETILTRRNKTASVKHFAALPYRELPGFVAELHQVDDIAARALLFLILTVGRSQEVLSMPWSEFKREERLWVIPKERMKASRDHRVPLSDAALTILRRQQELQVNDYVFAGRGTGPLGKNALGRLLQRIGRIDITTHGFRSTFRDWVAEQTSHAPEVAEMALAHAVSSAVEAAYRRGDLLEKRRSLADHWTAFCMTAKLPGVVVPLLR